MEKDFNLAELYGVYGKLLTQNQMEIFDLYYECDLSLGEIAEIRGVSRQSVNDALRKVRDFLVDTEEKLGLYGKLKRIGDAVRDERKSTDLAEKIKMILEE